MEADARDESEPDKLVPRHRGFDRARILELVPRACTATHARRKQPVAVGSARPVWKDHVLVVPVQGQSGQRARLGQRARRGQPVRRRQCGQRAGRSAGSRWWSRLGTGYLLVLVAALLSPAVGRAQGAAIHVPVDIDPCVPIEPVKFEYLLGIELSAEASPGAQGQSAARVTLQCDEGAIAITVRDAVTRKELTRRVELDRVDPSARTRLMALTVAELVLASWMELRMEPRPVIEPVGPPPTAAAVARVEQVVEPQVKSPVPPLRLGASVGAFAFLSAIAPIPGLVLHLTQPLSRAWALHMTLQGGYGILPGKLEVDAGSQPGAAPLDIRLRSSAAALLLAARFTQRVGPFDLWAALGGLIGFAYLVGDVPAGSDLVSQRAFAPWAGPALQLALALPASENLRLFLQLEAGLLVLGARAKVNDERGPDHPEVAELRGGWVGAHLGFDVAL